MGSNTSKGDSPEDEEFKLLLSKMFKVQNIKDIGPIDGSKLEKIWCCCMDKELITLYSAYLERNLISPKKYGDKKVIYNLYNTLVKGTNSEIAELLSSLFSLKRAVGTPEGCDNFDIQKLITYLSQLFKSFIKSLQDEGDLSLNSWSKAKVGFNQDAQMAVIKFLIKDLKSDNSMVSTADFEKWLIKCPLLSTLQSDVLKKAYCYHDKTGTHQKSIPTPDFSVISKTRLDIHHVIYLNNNLLPELRQKWRLLFSSRYSGESWVIFLKSILDQGPTILLIWDKNNKCFGGFASSSWSLSPHFYGNDKCFLFTLQPTIDKFEPTNYNQNFQYINSAQATFPNGLGMGGQLEYWGLYIDSSMKFGKVSVSCSTFANYKQPTDETFDIEDIEVWGLGEKPVPLEPEARQRSVLDSQTDAKAVLEMMGKSQVSEGLREPVDDDE